MTPTEIKFKAMVLDLIRRCRYPSAGEIFMEMQLSSDWPTPRRRPDSMGSQHVKWRNEVLESFVQAYPNHMISLKRKKFTTGWKTYPTQILYTNHLMIGQVSVD